VSGIYAFLVCQDL